MNNTNENSTNNLVDATLLSLIDAGYTPGEAYDRVANGALNDALDNGILVIDAPDFHYDPIWGNV